MQQFHALPACVEELDFDALENVDFQVEDVKNSVEKEVIKQMLLTPDNKWQEFFTKIGPDCNIQYTSAPPVLVFDSAKTSSWNEGAHKSCSPVIPLSVQQAQLDNLDSQAISQPDWIQDDVQLSLLLDSTDIDASTTTPAPSAPLPQLAAHRLSPDQTVPFRRHDSTCSMVSSCSEVKTERRSLSESDSKTPSLPFSSTSSPQLFSCSGRRGRPCSDDLNDSDAPTDKKQRRREQNRRAATRCRNKRRAEFEQLKKDHEAVTDENERLKEQLHQMTSQFSRLQNEFTQHLQHCPGLTLSTNVSL